MYCNHKNMKFYFISYYCFYPKIFLSDYIVKIQIQPEKKKYYKDFKLEITYKIIFLENFIISFFLDIDN